jgi:hypothetical protein
MTNANSGSAPRVLYLPNEGSLDPVTHQVGGRAAFAGVPGLFHVASVEEALDTAVYLRSLPLDEIEAMGEGVRRWMMENLEARVVFRKAFAKCCDVWREKIGSGARQ